MKQKIKLTIYALIIYAICTLFVIQTCATYPGYSWYCKRTKDHTQPSIGGEISFVEKYNGFAIDKKHGDNNPEKVLYLTFDAGYENGNVSKILNILKDQNVTGAFFVLGNLIESNTALVNRMFDEGHLVCNHTYSHKIMVGLNQSEFKSELQRLEDTCKEKTGKSIDKFYRPPEGRFDEASLQYASDMGYQTIFWSFAYADWDNNKQMNADTAKKKILDNIHNGAIILLHPTSSTNAKILNDVITELKAQGYSFGSLYDLCGDTKSGENNQ